MTMLSKLFSFLGGMLVTLIIVAAMLIVWHMDHGDAAVDAVKRLRSPDGQKLAFLVSINDGSERLIDIEVMTSSTTIGTSDYSFYRKMTERVFRKRFEPDLEVNLHENIEWSADSSLLTLTAGRDIHAPSFKWAYDFGTRKAVTDPNGIESLWRERNQGDVRN